MHPLFGISETEQAAKQAVFTAREIYQQPVTWKKTCQQIASIKEPLQSFIQQVTLQDDFDVILTGAGTSEFVGNALYSSLAQKLQYRIKSFATTDLLTTPENYLSPTKPTLLISFGRSGNSPESIGAVDVAETVCQHVYHLFISCNKEGALSARAKIASSNCMVIDLAEETHDQSFAMTSSFSNMYLATYLAFHLDTLDETIAKVEQVATAGQAFLDTQYPRMQAIIDSYDYKRLIFLGSDVLKGISQESALKTLELSAGKTVAMFDSPLGFRHGPKSIIDSTALTIIYLSDNPYTRKYEMDLLKEMSSERNGNQIVVVCNVACPEAIALADDCFTFAIGSMQDNSLLALCYILFAQILALMKSLSLGNTPDNPCPSGQVNRVVKGVTIYPYARKDGLQ